MRFPRWMHRAYAALRGFTWQLCPSCDEPFGAHEWLAKREAERNGHIATVWDVEQYRGIAICPNCTLRGVGCVSHLQFGRVHAGCPFVLGRPMGDRREHG